MERLWSRAYMQTFRIDSLLLVSEQHNLLMNELPLRLIE